MNKKNFLTALENKNLTQKELSEKTGISEVSISRYLNGKHRPTSEILILLADELDCTIDFLLGRTDKPNLEILEENLPNELTKAGIKAIKVFKGLKVEDLTEKDIKFLIEFVNRKSKKQNEPS